MRSLLFAPATIPAGSKRRWAWPADGVILDLEDAVAISEKAATRPIVVRAFGKVRGRQAVCPGQRAGRRNGAMATLAAVVQPDLDGIILPKVEHAHDVKTADWLIANLERERGLPAGRIDLIPIIETARGISNLRRICRSGSRIRRAGLRRRRFHAGHGHGLVRDRG